MGMKAGANSVEYRKIKNYAAGDPDKGIEPLTAEVISKMMHIKVENVRAIIGLPVKKRAPRKAKAPEPQAPEPKTQVV